MKYPALLVWADRLVMGLSVVVIAVLAPRGPALTTAQQLNRVGLCGFTTLAIVGVWLVKLVIRQRSV